MPFINGRLIELREKRGLSQRDLAEKIGVPPGTVAMWEKGRRNPKHESIENMANALLCDVEYLMGVTNVPLTLQPQSDIFAGLSAKEKELFIALRSLPIDEYEKKMEEIIFFLDNQE